MGIRVLRFIEYEYEDHETMIKDMGHWNLGANAVKTTPRSRVSSAVMIPSEHVPDLIDWAEIVREQNRRGAYTGIDPEGETDVPE